MATNKRPASETSGNGAESGRRRFGVAEQVLVALTLGIVAGLFFGEMLAWLRVVGLVFIRLLQITVIPYISLALITGLGSLSYDAVRAVAVKGGSTVLMLWAIGLTAVFLMPVAFPDWPSATFFSTSLVEQTPPIDFLQLFIPSNPFFSYANAIVPAVVVFSILLGVALIGMQEKHKLIAPLAVARDALMTITDLISRLAPIGVFALIASAAGTIEIQDLARLQVYVVLHALVALILALWVLPALVTVVTPFRYRQLLRTLWPPMITAFATGSSLIVIPMLIARCQGLITESKVLRRGREDQAESTVEIMVPTVYPFPSLAALMTLFFPLFAGWYIGSAVPVAAFPTMMLAGVPTLFGGSVLAIPFLLELTRLPADLFQVFMSMDVINSRFGTLLSSMYYATVALIGSMAIVARLRLQWWRLARFAVVSMMLLGAVLFGVRGVYTHLIVVPYTKGDVLRSLSLMMEPQPAIVIERVTPDRIQDAPGPVGFQEIVDRGVLRACFQPNEYPSAFLNQAIPPQLVGFDVEVAHRLARRRGLAVEFLPARSEREAASLLDAGLCDIYARTLPVSAGRTKMFALTRPIHRYALALIVPGHSRDSFVSWDALDRTGSSLRLGVQGSWESQALIRSIVPGAALVPIEDMAHQEQIMEAGVEHVDGIVDFAEEGAAFTLLYPRYSVVVPEPTVLVPVAYAVARGNGDLLTAVNAWLEAEQAKGTLDELYAYWMLGGAADKDRQPRWSVIRNVLGWVE